MHEPISIRAALTFDEKDPDVFAMDAYDGGRLHVDGYDAPVVIDLVGLRQPDQVKAKLEHGDTVGHQELVEIAATNIRTRGRLSVPGGPKDRIKAAQAGGFKWDASICVDPDQGRIQPVPRGKSVQVNGQTIHGPVHVVRAGVLKEVSFVGVGGGRGTKAVVLAASLATEGKQMTTAVDTPVQDQELATQLNEQQTVSAALQKRLDALEAENTRMRADALGREVDEYAKQYNANPEVAASIRTNVMSGKISLDSGKLAIVEAALPKGEGRMPWTGPIHSKTPELDQPTVEAALLKQLGWPDDKLAKHYGEKTVNAALSKENRGWTMMSVADEIMSSRGSRFRGSRTGDDFIRATMRSEREVVASQGFSTISLTGILGNVANKELMSGYESVETTWQKLAFIRSVNDFKVHTGYRLDMNGSYKKVGTDGELKRAGVSEAGYSVKADTYGTIIALTRQMQANDDLGAFSMLPKAMGRAAAIRLDEGYWVLFLASIGTHFAAGNNNYFSGGSSNLQISSLSTAKQMFIDFVDPNGKPVLVTPTLLVVGSTNKDTADVLATERNLVGGSSTVVSKNPHAGTVTPICSPYINNTAIKDQDGNAIANQTSTGWGLLAPSSDRSPIHVGFYRGNQVPIIETADTVFSTLGMEMRGYHDFGFGLGETTGGVWSKGAA
ncbi:hypothetical protein [Planctomyces sp. SH-PL14]|uniref:phage major capsid protein n=1 Tax=Planctomyces sp. SH-PL14 TaxID=1632864 RepID=UPI00078C414D|nr:hypothetical protein [Planctomyces sp. SH-PL14]AMV18254.1 Mu-like prophage major head subunit gpT [Planctomyces sp. SH-PL14]